MENETKTETVLEQKPSVFRLMDDSQISQIETESETVKARIILDKIKSVSFGQKMKGREGIPYNNPDKRQASIYPLKYVLSFLDIAKQEKATHILMEIGSNQPLFISFKTTNELNNKEEETRMWIAPRMIEE